MRKAADRLTKNGKRRGRRPLYLSAAQIEAPLGARPARADKGSRKRPDLTTLLIVQRGVARRSAEHPTKQEIAFQTAQHVTRGARGKVRQASVETIARRLRRIDASVGVDRL